MSEPIIKTDVLDTKATSSFLKMNRSKIALGAIGVGVAKSFVDGEDDDLLSSAGKGIKTGLVTAGVAYGAEHLFEKVTVQDMVKGEITKDAKEVLKRADSAGGLIRAGGKVAVAAKIGLVAVGAATVLDLGQKGKDRMDSAKMKREQEFELKKRQKQNKDKKKREGYGYMNDGQIVFELFNARTGSHKMGNAKFN